MTYQSSDPARERRIQSAERKAIWQAGAGNRPVRTSHEDHGGWTAETWTVGSASHPAETHEVAVVASVDGIETRCDCLAAGRELPHGGGGMPCWHRAAVRLAILGELPGDQDQPAAGEAVAVPVVPAPHRMQPTPRSFFGIEDDDDEDAQDAARAAITNEDLWGPAPEWTNRVGRRA